MLRVRDRYLGVPYKGSTVDEDLSMCWYVWRGGSVGR